MVALVTYLPLYRIHEINEYFIKNIEIIKPKYSIVYIDNVYNQRQKDIIAKVAPPNIELGYDNRRNRNDTWLAMLRDFHSLGGEVMVVDSDNVVQEHLLKVHSELRGRGPVYTVLDEEAWRRSWANFMIRSRKIGEIEIGQKRREIFAYRVYDGSLRGMFRGGSVFFIGPKQVVVFTKLPELELIAKVERALSKVDIWLRNFISDETLLGVLAFLMGIKEVPWTAASHHHHHGSTQGKINEVLVATAHYKFGRGLVMEFKSKEFRRYMIKYFLVLLKTYHVYIIYIIEAIA